MTNTVTTITHIYSFITLTHGVRINIEHYTCAVADKSYNAFKPQKKRFAKDDLLKPLGISGNSHTYIGYEIICLKKDEKQALQLLMQAINTKVTQIKEDAMLMHNLFINDNDVKLIIDVSNLQV